MAAHRQSGSVVKDVSKIGDDVVPKWLLHFSGGLKHLGIGELISSPSAERRGLVGSFWCDARS